MPRAATGATVLDRTERVRARAMHWARATSRSGGRRPQRRAPASSERPLGSPRSPSRSSRQVRSPPSGRTGDRHHLRGRPLRSHERLGPWRARFDRSPRRRDLLAWCRGRNREDDRVAARCQRPVQRRRQGGLSIRDRPRRHPLGGILRSRPKIWLRGDLAAEMTRSLPRRSSLRAAANLSHVALNELLRKPSPPSRSRQEGTREVPKRSEAQRRGSVARLDERNVLHGRHGPWPRIQS